MTRGQNESELFEAARVGVSAYLSGGMEPADFLRALLRVAHGEYLIDDAVARTPAVAVRILALFRAGSDKAVPPGQWSAAASLESAAPAARLAPLFVPLSPREIEILDLVARGNSNKLVARQLGISDQTVKNHITTILRKLEVNDRTEAVVTALRNGWIKIDAPARAAGNV
ncbi:MAG: response regulator transcription factor [Chloroflexi bacterium]|nr:response regulator transcription factor [Chloroflexota bacterium]